MLFTSPICGLAQMKIPLNGTISTLKNTLEAVFEIVEKTEEGLSV
jgi:hypothetical protein